MTGIGNAHFTKAFGGFILNLIWLCAFVLISPLQAQDDTLRVLFIGNSHTYMNDVPALFANLSQSGGHVVVTDMSAPGGYSLEQHTADATTLSKIAQGTWDYVVLQEQSQYPVIEYCRDSSMCPAARLLDSLIHFYSEQTALYMTWGWRDGGQHTINGHSSPVFRDYFHMQDSVTAAYIRIADELEALLLPAGNAWALAKTLDSALELWQIDGYHATLKGSYLAACVFYATFFHQSPQGLTYTGGLTQEDAEFLQYCADSTVLDIESQPEQMHEAFELLPNYPNPFNASTTIEYSISSVTSLK